MRGKIDYFEEIKRIKKNFNHNFDYDTLPCPDIHNPWIRVYYKLPIEGEEPNYYNTLGQYRKALYDNM